MDVDVLIAGAGFAGAVMAERLAEGWGLSCLVVDRRAHVGGNAYDERAASGLRVHRYGPHWFHTGSARVQGYLSRFTAWQPAAYRVMSFARGRYWPFPINLATFEQLAGRRATPGEMRDALERWRVPVARPRNSEEAVLAQVGPALFRLFYEGYTRKQWGTEARALDASVCARIPVRTDRTTAWFDEPFQALPRDGYAALFERLLRHPRIRVELKADLRAVRAAVRARHLVYTGMIDELYDFRFGRLPYRSLRFERETLAQERFQPVVQVNYPGDEPWTRIVEYKHVTGEAAGAPVTTIVREHPEAHVAGRDPYYPMPTAAARAQYARYAELAAAEREVTFVGRLATYRYFNMDQVVGQALAKADALGPRLAARAA